MKLSFLRYSTSASISRLSHCVQRGGEDTSYSSTQRWSLFFWKKPISTSSRDLSGLCISAFPFSSFCTSVYKIPGFRDDWCEVSHELWLQGVISLFFFHCAFCWCVARTLLHLVHGICWPCAPCRGCMEQGQHPSTQPWLLSSLAALPDDFLNCPTKPFSLCFSPASTTLATF